MNQEPPNVWFSILGNLHYRPAYISARRKNIRLITHHESSFFRLADTLRSSLWFVPSLMALAAVGLSFLLPQLDRGAFGSSDWALDWLWRGGVESTRGVLTVLAGSIITLASLTYSITITALTLASAQYGPRLLRSWVARLFRRRMDTFRRSDRRN